MRLPAGSDAEWGDVLDAVVRVDPPRPARDPGGFDGLAVADAAALAASGRAFLARAGPASLPGAWPRATVARWRRGIERRLDAGLSPEARELVVPLVTGDRSALSTGLYADLRASGLIHLLALSGLHVVWLASIARAAVASLGGGVGARALAAALCAVFYAGIAGPLPSLLRAAVHECLMAAATLRGRALDPLQALALSALGLLACAPGWAADLGFQLSFAATLGLVTFGPWLGERAGRWRPWCAPFIPTLGAQTTALPLLLARFHAVSWVGTLSNLVAVPVSGLLLAAAWLGALAEVVVPGLGHPWFSAGEVLAAALRWTTVTAARAPGALAAAGAERGVPWCAAAGGRAARAGAAAPALARRPAAARAAGPRGGEGAGRLAARRGAAVRAHGAAARAAAGSRVARGAGRGTGRCARARLRPLVVAAGRRAAHARLRRGRGRRAALLPLGGRAAPRVAAAHARRQRPRGRRGRGAARDGGGARGRVPAP